MCLVRQRHRQRFSVKKPLLAGSPLPAPFISFGSVAVEVRFAPLIVVRLETLSVFELNNW